MPVSNQSVEPSEQDVTAKEPPLEQQTVLFTPGDRARPFAALPPGDCLSGESVGNYQVKELIGRGSFGAVYRAVDPRLGRDVAVKVAARSVEDNPELRELFWNEARIQARLEHSNIVPIYDLLEDSGHLVIVMRLIHGEDLDKRLGKMVRPFTTEETLRLMRQVSSAVGAAHDMGVIHQDLKPGNIRLTPNADAVVLDFGVARMAGASLNHVGATGTPAYMSPEQINGDPVDARSDIYALALTLYKTLTGHHPFENARNLDELLAWQCQRPAESPIRHNPHLPGPLGEAILQGLEKDPTQRFRACGDFAHAVAAALGVNAEPPESALNARWNPRARINLSAKVRTPGEESIGVRVTDLSTSGAALLMRQPLKLGSYAGLVIRIPLMGSSHLVHCSMVVKRVSRARDVGTFQVGVVFQSVGNFDRAVLGDVVRRMLVLNAGDAKHG